MLEGSLDRASPPLVGSPYHASRGSIACTRSQILRSEGHSAICVLTLGQGGPSIRVPLRIERKQASANWYLQGIHGSESVQISNTRLTTFHISSQSLLDSKTGPMNCVKLRGQLNPAHSSVKRFRKSRGLPRCEDLTYNQKRIIQQSKLDDWLRDLLVRLELDKSESYRSCHLLYEDLTQLTNRGCLMD